MGHPSTISLDWNPERVRIGGTVAFVEERQLDDRTFDSPKTDSNIVESLHGI